MTGVQTCALPILDGQLDVTGCAGAGPVLPERVAAEQGAQRHRLGLVRLTRGQRDADAPGPGAGTFFEPITTTRPPRGASLSKGWHSRMRSRLASTLTLIDLRHSSVGNSAILRVAGKIPAFSTSMSMPPKAAIARAMAALICA